MGGGGVVVVVVVEVYLTSHHKQAISPPLIHVDDRVNMDVHARVCVCVCCVGIYILSGTACQTRVCPFIPSS